MLAPVVRAGAERNSLAKSRMRWSACAIAGVRLAFGAAPAVGFVEDVPRWLLVSKTFSFRSELARALFPFRSGSAPFSATGHLLHGFVCQSASKVDPLSASNIGSGATLVQQAVNPE